MTYVLNMRNTYVLTGSTNKSPTKLNVMENKFDMGDLFRNGENHLGKTPLGEFKVITPENPLLSIQVITSKRNASTKYQLIVEPLPQYPIGLVM